MYYTVNILNITRTRTFMARVRYAAVDPNVHTSLFNPSIDYLKVNNEKEWKLREVTNTVEYCKKVKVSLNKDKYVYTLYSSQNNILKLSTTKKENKTVTKLRFFEFSISSEFITSLLEVTFADKSKKIYTFHSVEDMQNCFEKMRSEGIFENKSYKDPKKLLDWKNISYETINMGKGKETYSKYFQTIANELKEILIQLKEVCIISPGVGCADDLYYLLQQLPEKIKYLAGFDINVENLKQALSKIPSGYFENISFEELERFILTVKAMNPVNTPLIVLFSGVLARTVVENKKNALRYLQYAVREADFIIIASFSDTFIDSNTAKATGLDKIKIIPVKVPFEEGFASKGVQLYKKPTPGERVAFLCNRAIKRKKPTSVKYTIDLSYSANPVKDLKLLLEHAKELLDNSNQLDLSWCYIKENEISELAELIKKLPFERVLIGPNDEVWARSLRKQLIEMKSETKKEPEKFLIRLDAVDINTPPQGSVPSLRRLGLLTDMECKPLSADKVENEKNNSHETAVKGRFTPGLGSVNLPV